MKILVVSQYYYPENFVVSKVSEKLVASGHDVTVLTGKPNYGIGYILPEYKNVTDENVNGVKIHRVNIFPRGKSRLSIIRNYLSFWRNSKKWVRKTKENFDVILSTSLSPVTVLSAGNLYKKKHHIKHVVHCVDLWPESVLATRAVKKNSLMYKILYKWSRNLYKEVDEVLISSPSFENYFKDVLKLDKKIKFVPQASLIEDSDDIKPIKLNDGFNIVYCGNLGILQKIESVPQIMSLVKNKSIYFHIIGMGPKKDELVENISKYGVVQNVLYHGSINRSESASFIKGADVVYLSLENSNYVGKTIPNKLMMYLALGKPILAVLDGDSKELLEKCNGGFVVDENIDNVAKTIENLVDVSKDELELIGSKNKTLYEKEFSLEKISKLIEEELLKNSR